MTFLQRRSWQCRRTLLEEDDLRLAIVREGVGSLAIPIESDREVLRDTEAVAIHQAQEHACLLLALLGSLTEHLLRLGVALIVVGLLASREYLVLAQARERDRRACRRGRSGGRRGGGRGVGFTVRVVEGF